jgi:GT2 family glycosyltransferase
MTLKLSIIIVNWNGRAILEECLNSVQKFPPSFPYDIFVVDNNSSDDSVYFLKDKKKELGERLNLILNQENVGFGRANNQAMRLSNAEYFFLLNSDAEVTPGAIDKLVELADKDRRIGIIGPKLLNADRSLQSSVWRNHLTPWEILFTGLKFHKLLPRGLQREFFLGDFWDHNQQREVKMMSAAAMLVRKELFDQIGGFDEDIHMYGEDDELCFRTYHSGWKLVFTPEAEVVHKCGFSSAVRWTNKEKVKMHTWGILKFQEKSLSKLNVKTNCLASIFVLSLSNAWHKIKKAPNVVVEAKLEVYREYLRNGLRN